MCPNFILGSFMGLKRLFWVLYGYQDLFYVFYGSIIWSNFNCWVYKLFIDTSYKVLRYSIKKLIRMGPKAILVSFMGLKRQFWVLYGYQDLFYLFYGSKIWSNFNCWVHKLFIYTSYKVLTRFYNAPLKS